ncbi:MAG: helix-turn-helix domain-containing protein [Thermoleophilia bacterium]|nr:helix-turn-helix domain-containing protein [Thermoleophilia bacterium]
MGYSAQSRRFHQILATTSRICSNAHMSPHEDRPDPTLRRIAELIRQERKRQGMDQQTLALVADVGVRTIHKIEHAQDVQTAVLLKVVSALGLELELRRRASS